MTSLPPRKLAGFMFLMAATALVMAINGYFSVQDDHGGGDAVSYLFEVGLPLFLFVGLLWQGIVLWRKDDEDA